MGSKGKNHKARNNTPAWEVTRPGQPADIYSGKLTVARNGTVVIRHGSHVILVAQPDAGAFIRPAYLPLLTEEQAAQLREDLERAADPIREFTDRALKATGPAGFEDDSLKAGAASGTRK